MLLFLYQKTAKIYLSLTSDTVKLKKQEPLSALVDLALEHFHKGTRTLCPDKSPGNETASSVSLKQTVPSQEMLFKTFSGSKGLQKTWLGN